MIKYNQNIDFIEYIDTGINIDDIRKTILNDAHYSLVLKNRDIKNLLEKGYEEAEFFINDSLSYMLRTKANLFFKKTAIPYAYLLNLYENNKDLENQNVNDFKLFVKKKYELKRNNFSKEELTEAVKVNNNFPHSTFDNVKSVELVQALINDEDMFEITFKSTIKELKNIFIKEKIDPFKEDIKMILEEDNKRFTHDNYEFLSSVSFGLIKESDFNVDDYNIFLIFAGSVFSAITETSIIYSMNNEKFFTVDIENELLSTFIKFISDPKRYQMLQVLKNEKKYANELAKQFKITPATMSYHINKLYTMGLISFVKSDQNKMYIQLDKVKLEYFINKIKIDLLD